MRITLEFLLSKNVFAVFTNRLYHYNKSSFRVAHYLLFDLVEITLRTSFHISIILIIVQIVQ